MTPIVPRRQGAGCCSLSGFAKAPRENTWLRLGIVIATVWLLVAGLVILQLRPNLLHTHAGWHVGWLLLVVVGPPGYMILEFVFGRLLAEEQRKHAPARRFAWWRVLLAFIVLAVVFSSTAALGWMFGQ